MKLRVKANDGTGYWEIHDESGFLCNLESESTARLLAHAANVLPELVAAVKHLRRNWRKNLTKPMAKPNQALAQAENTTRKDRRHLN